MGYGAAAAAAVGGGILGQVMSAQDKKDAAEARQQALNNYNGIVVPSQEQQMIQLQQQKSAGALNPQMQQLYSQGPSAMNDVATDPRLKTAQLQALAGLQNISSSGGMTAQDQANQQQFLSQSNQQEQANRGAIQQQMAQRGMGGSGFDLAAQLSNQQGSAMRANQESTNIAAQAQARALQALQMGGSMAGGMQSQDFNQRSQVANANDLISRFNTQNQQQVGNSNTDASNRAQAANLQNNQNISNNNTGLANQQQMYNKGLAQTQFQDQMTKANGQSGALTGIAQGAQAQAAQTAGMYAGIGKGAGQAITTYNTKKNADDGSQD